jgi:polysaccharide export outer membrane protein
MHNDKRRPRVLPFVGTLLFMSFICAAGAADAADAPASDYRLHAGDKLDIAVWKEIELTKPIVVVNPDGRFTFPLAGDIMAVGKTVGEVRTEIENHLKRYIPEPVVTVAVTDFGGNVAYVIGQVAKPGVFIMNPRINVLQALALAGGGTPFAKLDSIIILRGSQQSQRALPFRFSQVSSGKSLEQNVVLESGDVVVVP